MIGGALSSSLSGRDWELPDSEFETDTHHPRQLDQ
jgi:hypothetical protein